MKHARTIVPLAAVAVLGAGAFLPASAAKPLFEGSYKVSLQPDPTPNALNAAGMDSCQTINPNAADRHDLVVPLAGKLKVVLDSPDPTGRGLTDWDLWVLDKDGNVLAEAATGSSHEEANLVLKTAKTPITIAVCNLAGTQDGTVEYSLKK